MAKQPWDDDLPASKANPFKADAPEGDPWDGDAPAAKVDLPAGMLPSAAGGGRGSVVPTAPPQRVRITDLVGDPSLAGVDAPAVTAEPRAKSLLERTVEAQPMDMAPRRARPVLAARSTTLTDDRTLVAGRETAKRSLPRAAADAALGIYQGAAGMVKGVADNVNAGDNPVSNFLEGANRGAERLKSDDLREQVSVRAGRVESAKASGGEMGAARAAFQTLFDLPAAALDVGAQGAGSLVPTLLLGAAGAGTKIMGAVNAASTAGDSAAQVAEKLRKLPGTVWADNGAYAALTSKGVSHEDAVAILAPIVSLPAQAAGALAGMVSGRTGAEKVIAGQAVGNTVGDRVKRFASEMAGEQLETLAPGVAGNAAVGAVDGKTGLAEGLGQGVVDTAAGTLGPAGLAARRVADAAPAPAAAPITPSAAVAPPSSTPTMADAAVTPPTPTPIAAPAAVAPPKGALARAAERAGATIDPDRPPAMRDPFAAPKTMADMHESQQAVAQIEAEQDAQAEFEAAMLADQIAATEPKGSSNATPKPEVAAAPAAPAADAPASPRAEEAPADKPAAAADGTGSASKDAEPSGKPDEARTSDGSVERGPTADAADVARPGPVEELPATGRTDDAGAAGKARRSDAASTAAPVDAPAPRPADRAERAPAAAPRATFRSIDEAAEHISKQRARGTSIAAIPVTTDDGEIVIATKGSPEYQQGLDQRQERIQAKARADAGIQDGDVLTKTGQPFKNEMAARNALKNSPGRVIVKVRGGLVLRKDSANEKNARPLNPGQTPDIQRMAVNSGSVPVSDERELSEVRGRGDNTAPGLGGELRAVPGGIGGAADSEALSRPNRQQPGLPAGERSVGNANRAEQKSKRPNNADGNGADADAGRVGRKNGPPSEDDHDSNQRGVERGESAIDSGKKKGGLNVSAPEPVPADQPAAGGRGNPDAAGGVGVRPRADVQPAVAAASGGTDGDGKPGAPVAPADARDGALKALQDITKPITSADAAKMLAGKTEKPGGVDPGSQFEEKGTRDGRAIRIGDVPLDMFVDNEAGDLYDGTVNPERAAEYAKRPSKDVPPVIGTVPRRDGKLRIIDGGHRISAARMRGDKTIRAIVFTREERNSPIAQDPVPPQPMDAIAAAAHEAATSPQNDLPEPTQAQKEAGNYRLGHLSGPAVQGLRISVENPQGSERRGTSPDGTAWANTMGAHYGYVKGSEAADGDHVDIFVGPAAERAPRVWVVDQINPDGSYDEAKVLFGFMNKAAAVRAYRSSYSKGWKVGPVTEMSVDEFKAGLAEGRFLQPLDAELSKFRNSESLTTLKANKVVNPAAPKAKRESKTKAAARESEAARAAYFAPGNVVQGYAGLDRVVSYTPPGAAGEPFRVKVRSVRQVAPGQFEDVKGEQERQHSTEPAARDLKKGPVFAAPAAAPEVKNRPQNIPENIPADAAEQRRAHAEAEKKRRAAGDRARLRAWEDNPGRAFIAKHGIALDLAAEWAPGLTERRQAMVQGFGPIFRKSGMQMDTLAEAAVEEGFLQTADEVAMHAMIDKAIRKERVVPLYAESVAEDEMEGIFARQREAEQEAYESVNRPEVDDDFLAQLEDDAFPWDSAQSSSTVSDADFLRSLGVPEDEIQAEIELAARNAQRRAAGDPGPDQSEAVDAQAPDPASARREEGEPAAGEQGRPPVKRQGDLIGVSEQDKGKADQDIEQLRQNLIAAENAVLMAAKGIGNGDIDAAMKSRHVPPALKERRNNARQALREERARLDDVLSRPTAGQVVAQQERAAAGEKDAAARRRAEQDRLAADAQRAEFTLTGSDRAADANPDQGVMFSVDKMRAGTGRAAALPTTLSSVENVAKAERLLERLNKRQGRVNFRAVELTDKADPELAKTLGAVRTTAKRLFGHDVVFVQFDGPAVFNGAISASIPDTVFVRIDSAKPHMAILGHELLHAMRMKEPALYRALDSRMQDLLNDKQVDFYDDLQRSYDAMGREMPDDWQEELFADIVGDNFTNPEFWRAMAAEQPGLFRRVADAIVRFLDRVIQQLNPFGTSQFLTDANEARRVVVQSMRAFSQAERTGTGLANAAGESLSAAAPAAPASPRPNLTKAIFEGSMAYMRDVHGKIVKHADQVAKHAAIDVAERGQMLLRLGHVTEAQLKRWKASPLDIHDAAVNKRFRIHFETPGVVFTDDELRRIFSLDDAGIAAYRDLRATADTSIARHAVADMLRLAGQDGLAVRDQVLAEPLDVAAITLRDHLLAAGTAGPARDRALTDTANEVIDILDEANDKIGRGFVPDDMKADARPNDWESKPLTRMDRLIYEVQDGRIDLKRTVEAITEKGNAIREEFDPRLAETLYSGRVATRTQVFHHREAQPLLELMARNRVSQTELGDYLHARAAPERNAQIAKVNPDMPDGGAGANSQGLLLTTAAAQKYIADLPAERRATLESMAKRVDDITRETRALLVVEGLEKADVIAAWEKAYTTYVPMFREDVEFSRLTTSKRATGSEKQAVNILANVLLQREAAITRAEKNRINVAMYGLALTNPNPDFWATIRPESDAAEIRNDLIRMGIDPVDAEAGMQGVPTIRTVDPVTNQVVDRLNPFYRNLPGAIALKINGEHRVLMLNVNDPRAERLAKAMKAQDSLTIIDLAGSIVGRATRWLAAVNTQYNPVFGLVNFVRDATGGIIHLGNTQLRGDYARVMAGIPGAMRGIGAHLAGAKDKGRWHALFEQFQADGAQTGFREMFADGSARAARLEKDLAVMQRSKADLRRVVNGLLGLLSGFNEVTENAVRLAAYATALDKGISRPEAARLARELTVDFNRKGRATRELGPLYAFFNAAIQGNERTLRALRGPTGKAIITGGVTLGIMQSLLLAAAGYDEDDIPDFAKARGIIIPMFGPEKTYIVIPLPLGLHVLPNTGRIITDMAIGNHKKMGKQAMDGISEVLAAFNPLGGGNILTMDGALRTVAPTVIDPAIEVGFNKNFVGNAIEKDLRGANDTRPGFQRTRESTVRSTTGQAYIGISKALNKMTGGSDFEQGAISPTPERVRYIAQTALGGVLREVEKVIDISTAADHGKKTPNSKIPVVGRFYGEVENDRVQQSRYFEKTAELEKVEAQLKAARKGGDKDAFTRIQAANPDHIFIEASNETQKRITELNKLAIHDAATPEQRRAVDEKRIQAMQRLNEAVRKMERRRREPTVAEKVHEFASR